MEFQRPLGGRFQGGHLSGALVPPFEELRLEEWRGALAIAPCLHVSPVLGVLERAVGGRHGPLSDLNQQVPQGRSDHFQVLLVHWLGKARCGRCHQRHQLVLRGHVNVRILGIIAPHQRPEDYGRLAPQCQELVRGANPQACHRQ